MRKKRRSPLKPKCLPRSDLGAQQDILSQVEKDLVGLERLHSLQMTLILNLRRQLSELRGPVSET